MFRKMFFGIGVLFVGLLLIVPQTYASGLKGLFPLQEVGLGEILVKGADGLIGLRDRMIINVIMDDNQIDLKRAGVSIQVGKISSERYFVVGSLTYENRVYHDDIKIAPNQIVDGVHHLANLLGERYLIEHARDMIARNRKFSGDRPFFIKGVYRYLGDDLVSDVQKNLIEKDYMRYPDLDLDEVRVFIESRYLGKDASKKIILLSSSSEISFKVVEVEDDGAERTVVPEEKFMLPSSKHYLVDVDKTVAEVVSDQYDPYAPPENLQATVFSEIEKFVLIKVVINHQGERYSFSRYVNDPGQIDKAADYCAGVALSRFLTAIHSDDS